MGASPGTKHQKSLHPKEPAILWAIGQSPSVRKVETLGIEWTGPKPWRLVLSRSRFAGTVEFVVEGELFIGSGKRHLTICPKNGVGLEALKQELAITLAKYRVDVEIKGEANMIAMDTQQVQSKECAKPVLTQEERWAYCVMIRDLVEVHKGSQQEVQDLRARAEELEGTMQQVQQEALDILALLAAANEPNEPNKSNKS